MIDRREIYLPLLGCVLFGVTLLVELRGADEPTVTDVLPRGALSSALTVGGAA